jgi:hypothetical protein
MLDCAGSKNTLDGVSGFSRSWWSEHYTAFDLNMFTLQRHKIIMGGFLGDTTLLEGIALDTFGTSNGRVRAGVFSVFRFSLFHKNTIPQQFFTV